MRTLGTIVGRRLAVLLACLAAGAVLAGAGDAKPSWLSRKAGGKAKSGRTLSGRIQAPRMTMRQGALSRDHSGLWRLDGTPVRLEAQFSLVAQGGADAPRLTEGAQACLMGYHRHGVFVAYSGLLLTPPELDPPAADASADLVTWSQQDPTVGEASPNVPK